MTELDPLEESVLRRALRLEADERPPRFDVAAVAAAAREQPTVIGSRLVAIAAGVSLMYAAWSAITDVVPVVLASAFDGALSLVASAAVPIVMAVETAQQPIVPISLLAALAVALLHELHERREMPHAIAS